MDFPILYHDSTIGTAHVKKEGLYYCISCTCALPNETMFNVIVSSGDKRENLGLCVPHGGSFGLENRLPIKRLGEGTLYFCAVPKTAQPCGEFVPLDPGKPFVYITELYRAHLIRRNGVLGIELRKEP